MPPTASPSEFARTPRPERLCNLDRLLDTMKQRGMDGIVSYLRPNVFYLSGFGPPASASIQETNGYAAVVVSRHEPQHPVIVVAEFDLAHVLLQPSWIDDARPYATLLTPLDVSWGPSPLDRFVPAALLGTERGQAARARYASSLIEGVTRAMQDLGLARGTVGFDDLRFANAVAPATVRVVDAYGTLKYVRQVKTPDEVSVLREATRLNQEAIARTIRAWSRGTTWQEMTRTYHTTAAS
ncbi:MAG: aminopeptidase P family N-terminal domain-containing protein, partial [Candidatus Rokuibacteriota bacterium]